MEPAFRRKRGFLPSQLPDSAQDEERRKAFIALAGRKRRREMIRMIRIICGLCGLVLIALNLLFGVIKEEFDFFLLFLKIPLGLFAAAFVGEIYINLLPARFFEPPDAGGEESPKPPTG